MLGGPITSQARRPIDRGCAELDPDSAAARMDRAQRRLWAPLKRPNPRPSAKIAKAVGRGAPAVSRSVDALVRSGLVDRAPDPDNRRRLALRLTEAGRDELNSTPKGNEFAARLERFAHSELRAIERAIEILEQRH